MLSTPFICCSIGVATACSIVIASAPGYVVVTMTCGGTISGNCARGRPPSDTTPTMTVMMAMTIATMGRLMKNFAKLLTLDLRERLRRDDASVADGHRRPDDDLLTGLDAAFDDLQVADAIADGNRADGDMIASGQDLDLITALEIDDGALRNHQR